MIDIPKTEETQNDKKKEGTRNIRQEAKSSLYGGVIQELIKIKGDKSGELSSFEMHAIGDTLKLFQKEKLSDSEKEQFKILVDSRESAAEKQIMTVENFIADKGVAVVVGEKFIDALSFLFQLQNFKQGVGISTENNLDKQKYEKIINDNVSHQIDDILSLYPKPNLLQELLFINQNIQIDNITAYQTILEESLEKIQTLMSMIADEKQETIKNKDGDIGNLGTNNKIINYANITIMIEKEIGRINNGETKAETQETIRQITQILQEQTQQEIDRLQALNTISDLKVLKGPSVLADENQLDKGNEPSLPHGGDTGIDLGGAETDIFDLSKMLFYCEYLKKNTNNIGNTNIIKQSGELINGLCTKIVKQIDRPKDIRENVIQEINKAIQEYNQRSEELCLGRSYKIFSENPLMISFENEKKETIEIKLESTRNSYRCKISHDGESILLMPDFLIEKIEGEEFDSIIKEIDEKKENMEKEKNTIKNFDLPKDESIQYTRIFATNDDNLLPSMYGFSEAFGRQLQKNYKINIGETKFADDPEKIIKETVLQNYPSQKNFFFDMYSHGSPTELSYDKPITIEVFKELARQYPDCKFYISTIGCFGGGLIDPIKDQKDLTNVFVFTQVKSYLPNMAERGGSAYYWILLKNLQEGKGYGEAIFEADKKINELNIGDAESFLGGEYIAEMKKQQEQGDSDNRT